MILNTNNGSFVRVNNVSKLDYLMLAIVVYVSGLATPFFRAVEVNLILFVLSFSYLVITGRITNRAYVASCVVWFAYVLLSYLKYMGDNLYWPLTYFVNLTIAYALIRYFGERIFEMYSDVIYRFCLLSLVFFASQAIFFDSMLSLWYRFDISDRLYEKPYAYYAHTFLYTIHQFKYEEYGIPRNSGFCWEPGAFSCFIVLAVYFQLLKDGFKIQVNSVRYSVFLFALLTTQSTTGFMAFLVVLVCYVVNIEKVHRFKYYAMGLVISLPLLFALPSQIDKVESQLGNELGSQLKLTAESETERSLGRFESIEILFIDFINNPILGIGADKSISYIAKLGLDVSPTSGVGNMFARYGLFLMIPFFIVLYKTSSLISGLYTDRLKITFFLVVFTIGFSFSLLETPIFLGLIFFGYFSSYSLAQPRISHLSLKSFDNPRS